MAAIAEFVGLEAVTSTAASRRGPPGFDAPYTTVLPRLDEDGSSPHPTVRMRRRTASEVEPSERGDQQERDLAESLAPGTTSRPDRADQHEDSSEGEAARVRSELARGLIERLDELATLLGDISFPTSLQLWKRDLAHVHDALRSHPSEDNFVSLVTLLEAATAQLRWKQYNRQHLKAFRNLLDLGYRKPRLTFDDCEKARHSLAANHVEASPSIDLNSLNLDDLADDQEDEATSSLP